MIGKNPGNPSPIAAKFLHRLLQNGHGIVHPSQTSSFWAMHTSDGSACRPPLYKETLSPFSQPCRDPGVDLRSVVQGACPHRKTAPCLLARGGLVQIRDLYHAVRLSGDNQALAHSVTAMKVILPFSTYTSAFTKPLFRAETSLEVVLISLE